MSFVKRDKYLVNKEISLVKRKNIWLKEKCLWLKEKNIWLEEKYLCNWLKEENIWLKEKCLWLKVFVTKRKGFVSDKTRFYQTILFSPSKENVFISDKKRFIYKKETNGHKKIFPQRKEKVLSQKRTNGLFVYRISDKKRFSHREQNMLSQKRNSWSQKRYFLKERKEIAKEKSLTSLTALISRSPTFPCSCFKYFPFITFSLSNIYKKTFEPLQKKGLN